MTAIATTTTVRRIHVWQHGRAVREILRAYAPGTDTIVDQMRSASTLKRLALQHVYAPLYFAREQGWVARGERGAMEAILYLRREQRRGIRVMHVDEISVSPEFRRAGLAQRLLALAEELAREEQRPFLKLAVTVANTPAATLYRRLGYQEEHHRYFSLVPTSTANALAIPDDLTLRLLRGGERAVMLHQFHRMELAAGAPALAEMMATYYPLRVPRRTKRVFAIERSGQPIGYGNARPTGSRWDLNLCLRPELWGAETERHAIRLLAASVPRGNEAAVTISVPCAAHHEKLRAVSASWAHDFALEERSYDRMLMVKLLQET